MIAHSDDQLGVIRPIDRLVSVEFLRAASTSSAPGSSAGGVTRCPRWAPSSRVIERPSKPLAVFKGATVERSVELLEVGFVFDVEESEAKETADEQRSQDEEERSTSDSTAVPREYVAKELLNVLIQSSHLEVSVDDDGDHRHQSRIDMARPICGCRRNLLTAVTNSARENRKQRCTGASVVFRRIVRSTNANIILLLLIIIITGYLSPDRYF